MWCDVMRCGTMWSVVVMGRDDVMWCDDDLWCDDVMMWYDVMWCDDDDVMWCDVWCDVMRCDVMWWHCDVIQWCDVMWCDVLWCDVMWCVMWCVMTVMCDVMCDDVMWLWWCDGVCCDVTMWCDDVMLCDDVMMWCDMMWCDDVMWWCDVMCDVIWCGCDVWCGSDDVMWCDVMWWCDVMMWWCSDVMQCDFEVVIYCHKNHVTQETVSMFSNSKLVKYVRCSIWMWNGSKRSISNQNPHVSLQVVRSKTWTAFAAWCNWSFEFLCGIIWSAIPDYCKLEVSHRLLFGGNVERSGLLVTEMSMLQCAFGYSSIQDRQNAATNGTSFAVNTTCWSGSRTRGVLKPQLSCSSMFTDLIEDVRIDKSVHKQNENLNRTMFSLEMYSKAHERL
jgi:hypothetical protein